MGNINNGKEREGKCSKCPACCKAEGCDLKERLVKRKLLREIEVMTRDDFRKEKFLCLEILKAVWMFVRDIVDWLKHVFPIIY